MSGRCYCGRSRILPYCDGSHALPHEAAPASETTPLPLETGGTGVTGDTETSSSPRAETPAAPEDRAEPDARDKPASLFRRWFGRAS